MTIYLQVEGRVIKAKLLETSWTNESRKCVWKTACHTTDRLETDQGDVLETELSEDDKKRLMENTTYPKGFKYFMDEELARRSRDFCGVWVNYFNGETTETFTPDGERMSCTRVEHGFMEVREYHLGCVSSVNIFKEDKYHGDQISYHQSSTLPRCIEKYVHGKLIEKRTFHMNGILRSRENERFTAMYDEEGYPTKIVKGGTVYFFEGGVLKEVSVFGDRKKDLYKRIKLKLFRGRVQRKIMKFITVYTI